MTALPPNTLPPNTLPPNTLPPNTLPPNTPAPAAPARAAADRTPVATPALYEVRIGHVRTRPVRREFVHRATLWLVDLDDVAAGRPALGRLPRWLAAQARFEAGDHLGDPDRTIKDNVAGFARLHGVPDIARVVMLAQPRSGLGGRASYVFNPLSTHWCYRADGTLACIVAEVHNTYGERHAYLVRPDERGRDEVQKDFYVSPFLTVVGRYRMQFSPPAQCLRVSIGLHQDGALAFTAWVRGEARPATVATVATATLRRPLMALRISALIRLQGIRLWLRRLPVVPRRPHAPPPGVAAVTTGSAGSRRTRAS